MLTETHVYTQKCAMQITAFHVIDLSTDTYFAFECGKKKKAMKCGEKTSLFILFIKFHFFFHLLV